MFKGKNRDRMSKFNYQFQATRRSGILHLPVSQSVNQSHVSYDELTVEL